LFTFFTVQVQVLRGRRLLHLWSSTFDNDLNLAEMNAPIANQHETPPASSASAQADALSAANSTEALQSKHSFPDDLKKNLKEFEKEQHKARIKALRSEIDHIEATQWKYQD